MRMNNQTKLLLALEHIAHLEDLFVDMTDEPLLAASLRDIKMILDRQYNTLSKRRQFIEHPYRYRLDELQE